MEYLNRPHGVLYPDIIYCEGIKDDVYVEVAMQHNNSYTESATALSIILLRRRVEPFDRIS